MTTETASASTSPEMRVCISDCLTCYSTCTETVTYCLERGGNYAQPAHIRLLLDCAEICRTAADFMLRGSDHHTSLCTLTAEIVAACARSCAEFNDDPHMKACVDTCLRCASSCKQITSEPMPRGDYVGYDKISADSYPASDPPSSSGSSV